ncbi:MAG: addiction module protein [Chloroflexi bacterium]|nr:addiction module protein [Chloroflexota bacterium]
MDETDGPKDDQTAGSNLLGSESLELPDHGVSGEPAEPRVPDSHLKLVEERLAEYRRDPTRVRSAYEVLDRLGRQG